MSLMDALENDVLDALFGAGATLVTDPIEIGLSTTTPADDGSNITEPGGFGYARAVVANDGVEFGAAAAGVKTNLNTISFPAASGGAWGVITHFVIYEQVGGAKILWGVLDDGAGTPVSRLVSDGDTFRFLASALRITMD